MTYNSKVMFLLSYDVIKEPQGAIFHKNKVFTALRMAQDFIHGYNQREQANSMRCLDYKIEAITLDLETK